MWPYRKKIGVDTLRQIINMAEQIQTELDKGKNKKVLPFLRTLAKINVDDIDNLLVETKSQELVDAAKETYTVAMGALNEIEKKDSYAGAKQALDRIIALQAFIRKGKPRAIYSEKDIEYVRVNKRNWPKYRQGVINLEEIYFGGKNLEEDPEDLDDYANEPSNIVLVAVKNNEVIGSIIGHPLEEGQEETGITDDPAYGKKTGFYVTLIETLPEYSGKSIAFVLFSMLAKAAAKAGYKTLSGNYREGASARNALRMGGKVLFSVENYFDTGETYHYIIIDLAKFR